MRHNRFAPALVIPVLLIAACIGGGGTATIHARGPDNATVTITEYSDYQCPACGAAEPVLQQVLDAYPTQVKFIYKDFPLPFHTYAQKAAEAAECAGAQDKYWEMHDVLFENQDALRVTDLKGYAADLDLNTTEFNACLDSGAMAAEVSLDAEEAKHKGVDATPTFFVNGRRLVGGQPFSVWQTVIEGLLT